MNRLKMRWIAVIALVFVAATGVASFYSTLRTLETATTTTMTTTTTSVSTTTVTSTVISTVTKQVGAVWEVRFSPDGGARERLTYWIDRSNMSVYIMIYSFTSDDVAEALLRAKERGVDVKVVMDSSQPGARGGEYPTLTAAGVEVRVDRRSGLMHNKVAIIDLTVVITGSYNWSAAAEDENRENLIVLRDPELAATYYSNFQTVWNASAP